MWYLIGMLVNDEDFSSFRFIGAMQETTFLLQSEAEVATMSGSFTGLIFKAKYPTSIFHNCKIQFKVINENWTIKVIKYCELYDLFLHESLYMNNELNVDEIKEGLLAIYKLNIAQIFILTCFTCWNSDTLKCVKSIKKISVLLGVNARQYIIDTDDTRFVCSLAVDYAYMRRVFTKLKILKFLL